MTLNYKILFSLSGFLLLTANGDIILQSDEHCGSNMNPKEEQMSDLTRFSVYGHIGKQYYSPGRDCVVVIIGEPYHQWQVELQLIDIDAHKCRYKEPCCNDYLKLFNAYTVDNARLFPSIPWRGICGDDMPKKTVFTSTQNYITIQFNADRLYDSKRGFHLYLRQFPRRSAGNDFYGTGFFGGWNDGSLNELQIDWKEQQLIPGDYTPGKDPTFEFDKDGISCYICNDCKKDYFKSSDAGVSKQEGCYVCTKEWIRGSARALRNCLSKSMYESKLATLIDTETGSGKVTDFRSCKVLSRSSSEDMSTYVNLCVCESNNCNHAGLIRPSGIMGFLILVLLLYSVKVL